MYEWLIIAFVINFLSFLFQKKKVIPSFVSLDCHLADMVYFKN